MRCSSCEDRLERYLEGTLTARQKIDVAAHLRSCAHCTRVLEELKVVDALLLTSAAAPVLPDNFTFAVMAEARSLPAPKPYVHRAWSFVALYLTAAWVAALAGFSFAGISVGRVFGAIGSFFAQAWNAAGVGSSALGHSGSALATFGMTVLLLDLAIAAAFAVLYIFVRPRLAAHIASTMENS